MDQPQSRPLEGPGKQQRAPATGRLITAQPGRQPLWLVVPGVIVLALAASACGGSPKAGVASLATTTRPTARAGTTAAPAGTTATTAATGGNQGPAPSAEILRDLVKYGQCMRSHGVPNFPDNPGSPAGGTALATMKKSGAMGSPAFRAAAKACQKYAPPTVAPPQITAQDQADYLKAADCMRNHGIVGFPDPVFSNGSVSFPIPQGMSTKSTQFLRAREVCELLIPPGLPYSKEAEGGQ